MHAERSLIARLESGNVDTLIEMLQSGDERQQAALRAYFGPNLHDRLTALAHKSVDQGARGRHDREKVVFIHDFFGGGLSSLKGGKQELLWMAPAKLIDGAFGRLRATTPSGSRPRA